VAGAAQRDAGTESGHPRSRYQNPHVRSLLDKIQYVS
jgi:hypothetical protein